MSNCQDERQEEYKKIVEHLKLYSTYTQLVKERKSRTEYKQMSQKEIYNTGRKIYKKYISQDPSNQEDVFDENKFNKERKREKQERWENSFLYRISIKPLNKIFSLLLCFFSSRGKSNNGHDVPIACHTPPESFQERNDIRSRPLSTVNGQRSTVNKGKHAKKYSIKKASIK